MGKTDSIVEKIQDLRQQIHHYQQMYYQGTPEIPDREFDNLYNQLLLLEDHYPEYQDPNSPTARVGSDLDTSLEEKKHMIPVLSLDKCYSENELHNYLNRVYQKIGQDFDIVIEEKIDGISLVLYYRAGNLDMALTRGNGLVGNDVTANARTVKDIPLAIPHQKPLYVRGELYITRQDFLTIQERYPEMEYANPRNLSAGIIRRKNSKETAMYPLRFFAYEAVTPDYQVSSHYDSLQLLKSFGFIINPDTRKMNFQDQEGINRYLKTARDTRSDLGYEIDGLVIKIDSPVWREQLGYTGHHPRWAIASKFEAPMASTRVNEIIFQVGRGGRITPVAILEPVELSGSTVSRATLHNEDYMTALEIGIGDQVTVSKRGDVIPAIEEVQEKNQDQYQVYRFPNECPACRTTLIKDGAHHYCPSSDCPGKKLGGIIFFAGKNMMDIQNLGEKTIEFCFDQGFIRAIPDIYQFDFTRLNEYPGYGEKRINLIRASIAKSKEKCFPVVLSAMGFKDIGPKVVEILIQAGYSSLESLLQVAAEGKIDSLMQFQGIGEKTAQQIIRVFSDPENIALLHRLHSLGLKMAAEVSADSPPPVSQIFKDEIWVITGSFIHFQPRDKAAHIILAGGGKVASTVSSHTSFLLMGDHIGSKYNQAVKLNIPIILEEDFIKRLNQS